MTDNKKTYMDECVARVKANILDKEAAVYRINAIVQVTPSLREYADDVLGQL